MPLADEPVLLVGFGLTAYVPICYQRWYKN